MDIRKLEYFIAAVEEGSFTRAAAKCFISQTAISQQIASMEQELDLLLFDRSEYRPRLTLSGESFYQDSKQIIETYNGAVNKAQSLAQGYCGGINIGVSGPMEKRFLPPILRRFAVEHPDINVEFKEKNQAQLTRGLEENMLDVIFCLTSDVTGIADIDAIPLFKSNICVITAIHHPWYERSEVHGNDLKNEKLIVFSENFSHSYYKSVVNACRADGYEPMIEKKVDSLDELLLMVCINQGIAFVSEEVVMENDNIHVIKLKESHHRSEYCIARNKLNKKSIIDEFIKVTLEGFSKNKP